MIRKTLLAAAAVCLMCAAPAAAQTDYTATLSAGAPSYAWDGGPGNGFYATSDVTSQVGCDNPGYDCETLLVKLETPGALTFKIEGQGPNTRDIDIHLYNSDASGKPGKLIVEGVTDQPIETISKANLQPGFYLVLVDYYLALAGTYKGTGTLKPSAGGVTPPTTGGGSGGGGTGADAAPTAALAKIAKKVKSKKLKSFKGTASDDKGVSKVEVGVVRKKGKKCFSLSASGKFAKQTKCDAPASWLAATGTTSWTFKLRKKLPKGKYVAFARATDSAGQAQSQFTPGNRRAFTVR